MSDPFWPVEMPCQPLMQGWSGGPQPSGGEFDTEIGPPLAFERVTADWDRRQASFQPVPVATFEAFVIWWRETLGRGVAPFAWRNPYTGRVSRWRIPSFTDSRAAAGMVQITADIIRLPE